MEKIEQSDMFLDSNPELKDKYERANFSVSVLGGNQSEEEARELGYNLSKNYFSVSTGGYNMGAMKGALEGANEALEEMKQDSEEQEFLTQAKPLLKGFTAGRFDPEGFSVKGENIKNEISESDYDLYLRLGKLIEDSKVMVILPGDTGTEVEVLSAMHFDKKLKGMFGVEGSPIVFIGGHYLDLLKEKFGKVLEESNDVYIADSVDDAYSIIDNLFNLKKEYNEEIVELLDKKLIKNYV